MQMVFQTSETFRPTHKQAANWNGELEAFLNEKYAGTGSLVKSPVLDEVPDYAKRSTSRAIEVLGEKETKKLLGTVQFARWGEAPRGKRHGQ